MAPASTERGLGDLLRLLVPRPGASEQEERMRAGLIMQRATRGPVPDFQGGEMDDEAMDRLKALQILQGVFGGAPPMEAAATDVEEAKPHSAATASGTLAQHELAVTLEGLPLPVRLLEAADSEEATRAYSSDGETDPFGAKAWPAAYLAARRLLSEGVRGRSVLELGCGTGLASVAALLGGAASVLATDRARPNIERAVVSARLNGQELHSAVFDVTLDSPLPSCPSRAVGTGPDGAAHCAELPARFDYVVFSDVLYWPREAVAFGRRAAEAFAAGSTVIVADPGRRRDDFFGALREELRRLGVDPLPALEPTAANYPEHVYKWVSAEVRTASSLFCHEPFELVLRQPRAWQQTANIAHEAPDFFEPVD